MEKKEIEHFNETVKSVLTENNLFKFQVKNNHITHIRPQLVNKNLQKKSTKAVFFRQSSFF